jgi:hypothetical protein
VTREQAEKIVSRIDRAKPAPSDGFILTGLNFRDLSELRELVLDSIDEEREKGRDDSR